MTATQLTETSPELLEALSETLGGVFNQTEGIFCQSFNSGGGVMVLSADLSLDARGMGRQLWLTREDTWILGVYDLSVDEFDEGVTVQLMLRDPDDPREVASQVAMLLVRLGVTKLQGA